MSKRYGEPIEIEATGRALEAFWWRGRRYRVRRVIGRWREAGGWWTGAGEQPPWAAGDAREVLRIDAAGSGRMARAVFEVARDLRSGAWTLSRILD